MFTYKTVLEVVFVQVFVCVKYTVNSLITLKTVWEQFHGHVEVNNNILLIFLVNPDANQSYVSHEGEM